MLSKPLGIAALAVATVGAAGLGSYLALRPDATQAAPAPVAATADAAAPAAGTPSEAQGSSPVTETEALVTPETPAPAGTPVEAPRTVAPEPAPARASRPEPRVESPRRPARPASEPGPASSRTARREPASSGSPSRPSGTVPADGIGRDRPVPGAETARTESPAAAIESARPAPPPEPPKPTFVEYVVPADSVMGLQIENSVSSAAAKLEDRVDARVTRDVRVGDEVAVPAGARVRGEVTLVETGGKFRERARLGVRFHTIVLADGTTIPINTETVFRDGEAMSGRTAAKIGGGAVGGAIIGAILGGGKGAAIGGAAGAGAGTAATMAGGRSTATLQAGSTVTVRLSQPATVRVEKDN